MPEYLARVTVHDVPDDETRLGMGEALGAVGDDAPPEGLVEPGTVTFDVPGEAPDLATAEVAAQRHAAEVLDDFRWGADVAATAD